MLLFRQVPKKRPHDPADAADEMVAALREPRVELESLLEITGFLPLVSKF